MLSTVLLYRSVNCSALVVHARKKLVGHFVLRGVMAVNGIVKRARARSQKR